MTNLSLDINKTSHELLEKGYLQISYPLSEEIKNLVRDEKWEKLDSIFHKWMNQGEFRELLQKIHPFTDYELMLAVRDPSVEEGIWHDDGSRLFAFTLSLTLDHENIEGGTLGFRRKGDKDLLAKLSTREFGGLTLFLTGHYGYEHKVYAMQSGKRMVLVGWCR